MPETTRRPPSRLEWFIWGATAMGLLLLVATTTPDQAEQHIRDWWRLANGL